MPSKKVDVQDLIRYITVAQGQLPLAVERINKDFETDYKKEDLLGAVAGNTGDLADQLRTVLILQMFDTQMQLQIVVAESLSGLTEADAVRFYTANASAISSLISKPVKMEPEEPVNFIDAKRNLVDRLEGYKARKMQAVIEEQLTGTDGNTTSTGNTRQSQGIINKIEAEDEDS